MSLYRVLFLDIDGVLHPARQLGSLGPSTLYMQVGPFGWLPELAKVLRPVPSVQVVIHSSWRSTYALEELREMLTELGERALDVTPPGGRYQSILDWLRYRPFASYLILDDEPDEFPTPPPAELIACDPDKGVSDARVLSEVRRWLDDIAG